jgi:hypothetical protein
VTSEDRRGLSIQYNAMISVTKGKMERKTKNLTELSDPGSLDGSPTDSENEFDQNKAG